MRRTGYLFVTLFGLFGVLSAYCAPPRVISLSPQVTEILFQLGQGQRIVATPSFSKYPTAAESLPTIGTLFSPNFEKIFRLAPDWIVADGSISGTRSFRRYSFLGSKWFEMDPHSYDELFAQAEVLLREVLSESERAELRSFQHCYRSLKRNASRRFLAFAWLDPPIIFSRNTLLSSLLARLGQESIVPDGWKIPFASVSMEWLLLTKPEVVYYLSENEATDRAALSFVRKAWPHSRVQIDRMDGRYFSRASFTPLIHADELVPHSTLEGCRAVD